MKIFFEFFEFKKKKKDARCRPEKLSLSIDEQPTGAWCSTSGFTFFFFFSVSFSAFQLFLFWPLLLVAWHQKYFHLLATHALYRCATGSGRWASRSAHVVPFEAPRNFSNFRLLFFFCYLHFVVFKVNFCFGKWRKFKYRFDQLWNLNFLAEFSEFLKKC